MPGFNFSSALAFLQKGLQIAEAAAPLIQAAKPLIQQVGGDNATKIADIVTSTTSTVATVNEVAQNISARIEDGRLIVNATEKRQLTDIIDRLQPINDELMAFVENDTGGD